MDYNREILVEILVYHYRTNNSGCGCGWAELGKSHPEHVADVYEASVLAHDFAPYQSAIKLHEFLFDINLWDQEMQSLYHQDAGFHACIEMLRRKTIYSF